MRPNELDGAAGAGVMSSPSPERPKLRRGRVILLILWASLFLVLLETLPRWSRRVRCDEPTAVQMITDDSSTLVAFSIRLHRTDRGNNYYPTWPIRLINLRTGEPRTAIRPEDPVQPAELRDEVGTLYRAAGSQTLHTSDQETAAQQSGDYLALTYETIDSDIPAKRLQVLNWRTGDIVLEAPFEGTCRFFGPRLLVHQQDGGSRLEIWDPAAKTIVRADWLPEFQGFDFTIVSPDGRWLILQGSFDVWDLAKGEVGFQVPKGYEDAVFSADGGWLVVVSRFQRERGSQPARLWRSLDTQSGALLREEQEVIDWPANRSPPRDGHLHFLSDHHTVRYDQYYGAATEWSIEGLKRLPHEEEEEETLPEAPWRSVAWSADGRWSVATQEGEPITSNLYFLFLSYVFPNGEASSSDLFPYELWNRVEARRIATLGLGSSEHCWFTPDGRQVVTQAEQDILIWDVPPRRPWGRAAAWSCTVPFAALLWSLRRRGPRRSSEGEHCTPAN